jgi:hypothetical protein
MTAEHGAFNTVPHLTHSAERSMSMSEISLSRRRDKFQGAKIVDSILADGDWHAQSEIIAALIAEIDEERAIAYHRKFRGTSSNLTECAELGRSFIARSYLNGMFFRGNVERKRESNVKMFRAVQCQCLFPIRDGVEFIIIPNSPYLLAGSDGSIWREKRSKRIFQELSGSPGEDGYVRMTISYKNKPKTVLKQRLILEAFVGPCPEGMEACHKNGKRADCRIENLRWDTPKGNAQDKEIHGTVLRGDKAPRRKLFENQVRDLLMRFPDKSMNRQEAILESQRLGVSPKYVRNIVYRAPGCWRHIDG